MCRTPSDPLQENCAQSGLKVPYLLQRGDPLSSGRETAHHLKYARLTHAHPLPRMHDAGTRSSFRTESTKVYSVPRLRRTALPFYLKGTRQTATNLGRLTSATAAPESLASH